MPAGPPPDLREAYARCEELARSRRENFPVLSQYISPEHAHHLAAVYGFCRIADDAADESGSTGAALENLNSIEAEIGRVFGAEEPHTLEMRALKNTVRERKLDKEPFLQLIDAFRQDQTKTTYNNWEELLDYSRRSANPVGRLVLATVGELDAGGAAEKLQLSDSICTGLQLANFWQDVARDHEKGRIYIPADAMAAHGVTRESIGRREASDAFRELLASLCDRTAPLFAEGAGLAQRVTRRLRIPILAFAIAGTELLDRIRAADYDIYNKRPEIGDLPLKTILAKAAAASFLPVFRPQASRYQWKR